MKKKTKTNQWRMIQSRHKSTTKRAVTIIVTIIILISIRLFPVTRVSLATLRRLKSRREYGRKHVLLRHGNISEKRVRCFAFPRNDAVGVETTEESKHANLGLPLLGLHVRRQAFEENSETMLAIRETVSCWRLEKRCRVDG